MIKSCTGPLKWAVLLASLFICSAVADPARYRVIVDNDFGGDPDGLYQLVHQLLSSATEVRAIIASQHYPTGFYGAPGDTAYSLTRLPPLLASLPAAIKRPKIFPGQASNANEAGAAATFIIQEALREDDSRPLFVLAGAGLTTMAAALSQQPDIANRLTLIWIGGAEDPALAMPPPGVQGLEYNLGIDPAAANLVFSQQNLAIWQVPRNAYRQTLVSNAELAALQSRPAVDMWRQIQTIQQKEQGRLGETYALGDSPLVLLSALQSGWQPDASSSHYVLRQTVGFDAMGKPVEAKRVTPVRLYHQLDTRLMLADFFAKMRRLEASD